MRTTRNTITSIAAAAFALIAVHASAESLYLHNHEQLTGNTVGPIPLQDGNSSAGLAGQWRCTKIMPGGDASITSDYNIALYPNGTFRHWKLTYFSFTGRSSTTELGTGRWTVDGGSFVFTNAEGQSQEVPFQRRGNTTIYLPESRQVWERVR